MEGFFCATTLNSKLSTLNSYSGLTGFDSKEGDL